MFRSWKLVSYIPLEHAVFIFQNFLREFSNPIVFAQNSQQLDCLIFMSCHEGYTKFKKKVEKTFLQFLWHSYLDEFNCSVKIRYFRKMSLILCWLKSIHHMRVLKIVLNLSETCVLLSMIHEMKCTLT